jgi:hypothetical protein
MPADIETALDAATALVGSSIETLKGADRGGDEGVAFKRSLVAALLAGAGFTHDAIADALGFGGKSGAQKGIELVRDRITSSVPFAIEYRRMVDQVRTASPVLVRFLQLRHALRGDNQTEIAVSGLAATLVLAESLDGTGSHDAVAIVANSSISKL